MDDNPVGLGDHGAAIFIAHEQDAESQVSRSFSGSQCNVRILGSADGLMCRLMPE
jgi:hypothetical protein